MPFDGKSDEAAISFLTSNRFPYHVTELVSPEDARSRVANGTFAAPENEAFWIHVEGKAVGFIVFEEVTDGTPMIDLRIAESYRGRGIGTAALRVGTGVVFGSHPEISRIEGNTRVDNVAMRKAFEAAGYVKEAHYRDGWTVAGAAPMDSVAYAILRRDWTDGVTTPVAWEQ